MSLTVDAVKGEIERLLHKADVAIAAGDDAEAQRLIAIFDDVWVPVMNKISRDLGI